MLLIQSSASSDETFKVHVVCPVCDKFEYLYIPKDGILNSERGLSTVFVHNQLVCEHSFQIFIDKNGKVRGFETPDFELKFTEIKEPVHDKSDIKVDNTLLLLRSILTEEYLLKSFRCGLNKHDIVCISGNEDLKTKYQDFFQKIFGSYAPKISIASIEEYNEKIRSTVFGSDQKNTFVFNPDLSVVVKEPFEKGFKIEKFAFENSLIQIVDINTNNDDQIVNSIYPTILKILDSARQVVDQVKSKKLRNQKDIIKKFQSLIGNLKFEADDMDRIMKFHFGYIPELTFLDF